MTEIRTLRNGTKVVVEKHPPLTKEQSEVWERFVAAYARDKENISTYRACRFADEMLTQWMIRQSEYEIFVGAAKE